MRTTLHTVNQSPHAGHALSNCLRLVQPGSCVLLIEDGVYASAAPSEASTLLDALPASIEITALDADVRARGLLDRLHPRVRLVDDEGFVALAVQHSNNLAWF